MLRLLLFMHHIHFAPPIQWVFRGPHASSGEVTNLACIKASPDASNHLT
jgi:hypothetical protein